MIFAEMPVAEAEGAILAHTVRAGSVTMKKGRTLSRRDIEQLQAAAIETVMAARLGNDDEAEDAAARQLADAAAGPGVDIQAAFTGRANLYASQGGLLVIDAERLHAINGIDEAITIASLKPYDVVSPRQMLATVKIIPFSAPRTPLAEAVSLATTSKDQSPLIAVHPFQPHRAGLIMTHTASTKLTILDKTEEVVRRRLERYGSHLTKTLRCHHNKADITAAIRGMESDAVDLLLLFGASAITDRRDVIPAGIVEAGGAIDHFGMPVDPGNLLLLAHLGDKPVIGLPGCARSPKLNGFDWVLERLLAKLPLTKQDIMRMGVGGLLKEMPDRPQPRDSKSPPAAAPVVPQAPRIGAVLLAAGQSRRMGRVNKLLLPYEGKPLVRHVFDATQESQTVRTVVVLGHEAERVRDNLPAPLNAVAETTADTTAEKAPHNVQFVHNPDYAKGLSTSVKSGLQALLDSGPEVDGAIVMLGDMPKISTDMINRLIAAFDPVEGRAIIVPTVNGKRGNPVLFARQFFTELMDIAGDVGARHLIGTYEELVQEVAIDNPAVVTDIDTPEAFAALRRQST